MALMLIIIWYVIIGVLAAAGTMYLTYRYVPVRFESVCYGLGLIPVASMYLAFTAYFDAGAAWPQETAAVVAFVVLGLVGTQRPMALIAGYVLHGGWDFLHELQAHAGIDVFAGRASTPIPLAYGAFCLTYDFAVAGYFIVRSRAWATARAATAG